MQELNYNQIENVSGGVEDSVVVAGVAVTGIKVGLTVLAVGVALATVGGAAYKTATALGADDLGEAIGGAIFDALN